MTQIKNIDLGLLIARIAIGGLMLFHGIHKLQAPAVSIDKLSQSLSTAGLPEILSYGVFIGEFLAPLLVIIGFRTKIFAPLIAFTMLVAIYVSHADHIFALTDHGGLRIELQLLYLLGALSLTFTGGGQFAISSKNRWD